MSNLMDWDRTVASDLPCGYCGYNLRGLESPGICPECGSPFIASPPPDACDRVRESQLRRRALTRALWIHVIAASVCTVAFAIPLVLYDRLWTSGMAGDPSVPLLMLGPLFGIVLGLAIVIQVAADHRRLRWGRRLFFVLVALFAMIPYVYVLARCWFAR